MKLRRQITCDMAKTWIVLLTAISHIGADLSCVQSGAAVTCAAGATDHVLQRGLVSDNNRTTSISLRNCRITDVRLESFENLFSLRSIDLSNNKIKRIRLGVLDGFRNLQSLNLSYNNITRFPLGLFDQKPNLRVLDLKGNRLEEIELGVFDPLRKLRHLDLASNNLSGKNLSPYIFDRCSRIQFIDFSHNDMSETPDIMLHAFRSIDFLNLDSCLLTEVPDFATRANLNTMTHLMLSSNKISELSDSSKFTHLVNLEKLNLAWNLIEEMHEDVFKPLKKIQLIFLFNNRISHIPETLFQNLQHLQNIDLSNNRIEYVPVNAFRGTNLKQLNLAGNRFTYLQDNFCLELRTSGAGLTKFFFERNPWQCACLNDLLIEVKKYGIAYHDRYEGRRPVCVTNEFNCKRQAGSNDYYLDLYNTVIRTL